MNTLQKSPAAKTPEERRSWPRIETTFSAIYADNAGHFLEEEVSNLSKGGLLLKTRHPRDKGERLELILILPDHSCEVTVQGEVMYVTGENRKEPDQREMPSMGIMFTAVEPQLKKWLGSFIDRLLDMAGGGHRETPRVTCSSCAIMINTKEGDKDTAVLGNLSQKGMFIKTDKPLSLFEEVRFHMVDADTHLEFALTGEVVHLQRLEEKSPAFGAGIHFLDLDAKTEETVLALIRETISRQRAKEFQQSRDFNGPLPGTAQPKLS